MRSLGGLAGGTFGTAFKVAAVAGVALLWVEVWNQFTAFQAKVAEAQADLQGKVDAATQQIGLGGHRQPAQPDDDDARAAGRRAHPRRHVRRRPAGRGPAQPRASPSATTPSLTAGEIEDALALLADASAEALARGNQAIADEIDAVAATLRSSWPGRGAGRAGRVRPALERPATGAAPVEPPAVAKPIREEFADARKAIVQGFGSIKQALADPPALIGREDRLANMERRFRKVMKNLRKAVEADDPFAVDYWTKAAAKQRVQIERMETRTTASVDDIRAAFAKAGVKIDGTWLDIGKGADADEAQGRRRRRRGRGPAPQAHDDDRGRHVAGRPRRSSGSPRRSAA